MSVYVDQVFKWPIDAVQNEHARRVAARHGGRWCHLWCDSGSEEELHRIAAEIGLQPSWFQDRPGFPHYDIVPPKREAAIKCGAIALDLTEWIKRRRD